MTWEDFQISVKEIVTEYIGNAHSESIFRIGERVVTIGFDDGELEKIQWKQKTDSDLQLLASSGLEEKKTSPFRKGVKWLKQLLGME